jgi:hypothetical protein
MMVSVHPARRALVLFTVSLAMVGLVPVHATPQTEGSARALELFKAGDFPAAERALGEAIQKAPDHYDAVLALAQLRLYANQYDGADRLLAIAARLRPDAPEPKRLQAESLYRRDRFAEATPLLRAAGQGPRAERLDAFKDQPPNHIEGPEQTRVPFLQTDPLPLVTLTVNGKTGRFVIDTGGAELILDSDFAKSIGARSLSTVTAQFAGGLKAESHLGAVDSVTLGGITVHQVPVNIDETPKRITF